MPRGGSRGRGPDFKFPPSQIPPFSNSLLPLSWMLVSQGGGSVGQGDRAAGAAREAARKGWGSILRWRRKSLIFAIENCLLQFAGDAVYNSGHGAANGAATHHHQWRQ